MPNVLGRSRLLLSLLKLGISKVQKSIGKEEKNLLDIYLPIQAIVVAVNVKR